MYQVLDCRECDGSHPVYLCKTCAVVHDGEMCGSWQKRTKAWLDMVKKQLGEEGLPVFQTLTFGGRYPGPQRGRKALAGYLDKVEGLYVKAFFSEERGAENDRLHYHGVIMAKPDLSAVDMYRLKEAWTHGFSKTEIINSTDAAISYVIKYVMKEAGTEASWFEFRKGKYTWL